MSEGAEQSRENKRGRVLVRDCAQREMRVSSCLHGRAGVYTEKGK